MMMTIPTTGPSYIHGDNMLVVHNTFRPELVLRKKSNSVCYHTGHESVTMDESLVGCISNSENVANLITKVLYQHRRKTWSAIFYN